MRQARDRLETAKKNFEEAKAKYADYEYDRDPWGHQSKEGDTLEAERQNAKQELKAAKANLKKLDPHGYAAEKKDQAKGSANTSYGPSSQDSFGRSSGSTRGRTTGAGPQAPPPRSSSTTPPGSPRARGSRDTAAATGAAGPVPVAQALGVVFAAKDPAQRAQALATLNASALAEAAASPAGALRKNPALAAVLRQAISTPGAYRRALASIHPDKFTAQFKENQGHLAALFGGTPQVANETFTERLTLVRTLLNGAKDSERPSWVS